MGLRRRPARSFTPRVPLPRPLTWAVVSSTSALLLVGVFVASAWPVSTATRETWPASVRALDNALWHNGTARNIGLALLLLLCVWAFRRWRFALLQRRPGPIDVRPFLNSTGAAAPVQDLMSHFLGLLGHMNLPQPAATPGDAAPVDFLHVVRTAANDAKNPLGTVAGLLPAVHITHAYRVSGVLRRRDGERPYGLTVHVSALPRTTAQTHTFWADTWTVAVEQAAYYVGAFVLPRSRLCRRPPWTTWRGLLLPWELFEAFQQADRLTQQRRFDEAVDAYHQAIRLDPLNPYLRLEVGELQERMGMYIDALSTNADVIAVQASTDRRYYRILREHLPRSVLRELPPRRLRSPAGGVALLVARYRFALLLGFGERLARQWHTGLQKDAVRLTRRDRDRERLREHLKPWLARYVPGFLAWRDGQRDDTCDLRTLEDIESDALVLQAFFQYVSCQELTALEEDYRWSRGRRRPGMPLSQTPLRLSLLWAPLRLTWTCQALTAAGAPFAGGSEREGPLRAPPPAGRRARAMRALLAEDEWPPSQENLRRSVDKLMRPAPRVLREYPDYYNAACTVAVCLLPREATAPQDAEQSSQRRAPGRAALPVPDRRSAVSELAIHYLELAVDRTESGFVATRADWLTSEDPDLVGLRPTSAFREFEATYFPRSTPSASRPHEVLRLQMSLYTISLVHWYASLRRQHWEAVRGLPEPPDPLSIFRGRSSEERAWALVGTTALQMRHWQARLELIVAGIELSDGLGLPAVPPSFPDFSDDEVSRTGRGEEPGAVNRLAMQRIVYRNEELRELQTVLQARRVEEGGSVRLPVARADELSGDWSGACRRQFELWESLERWMHEVTADPASAGKTRRAFMRRCETTRRPPARGSARRAGGGRRGAAGGASPARGPSSGAGIAEVIDIREDRRDDPAPAVPPADVAATQGTVPEEGS